MGRLGGALAVAVVLLAGCGNDVSAEIVGTTGISIDDAGNLVGLVAVCDGSVDQLTISGDRTGLEEDEPNPVIGTWKALAPGDAGIVTIDLGMTSTPPDWTMGDSPALEEGRTYIAIADQSDADAEAAQVTFTLADIEGLDSGQVLVRDGEIQPRSDFEVSCS